MERFQSTLTWFVLSRIEKGQQGLPEASPRLPKPLRWSGTAIVVYPSPEYQLSGIRTGE